jgi:hypothetical protein
MILPKEVFIRGLAVGSIYLLNKHKLKNTSVPHLFIIAGMNDEELVLFSCCTTQFEKRRRFIELSGLPFSTLVSIKPNGTNKLDKETHINCNELYSYTVDELHTLSNQGDMRLIGKLDEGKYEEMKTGINDSPRIVGEYKDIVNKNGSEE